jgi:glycosyltransferase involved in cell wall biosynthesis
VGKNGFQYMKLAFVIPEYNEDTSDHFYHLYQLIEKTAQEHEVFLIAEAGDVNCKIKYLKGYYVQSTKKNSLLRLLERIRWFIHLSSKGYKNFYCHYCEVSTITLRLLSLIFQGTIFKWHCSQQDLYRQKLSLKSLRHKVLVELPVELSIRLAHVLVTCTPQMKMYFQKVYKRSESSIYVLPNFICLADLNEKKVETVSKPVRLLFVHRLSPRKGANRLIDYAKKIKEENLPLKIIVVGDGPLYNSLVAASKKLDLISILEFKGRVPNSKISDAYNNADFLLMPSRDEEFGRVQIEAMKYGLPILATDTLSTAFVLSQFQKQLVVSQKNYLLLPDKALDLVKNPVKYNRLISEGYEQVKKFSLKQAVKNVNKLLVTYGEV